MKPSVWGARFCLCVGILVLAVFLPLYCVDLGKDTPATYDITLAELLPRLQPGDVILSARDTPKISHNRFRDNLIRLGQPATVFNHVSLVVRWNNEMYVFDVMPSASLLPFVQHTTPRFHVLPSPTSLPLTAMVPVKDFLSRPQFRFAYRAAQKPLPEDTQVLSVLQHVEEHGGSAIDPVCKWLWYKLQPKQPLRVDNITCVEGVSYVLEKLGWSHPEFRAGMGFEPYTEQRSRWWDERLYRVQPAQ